MTRTAAIIAATVAVAALAVTGLFAWRAMAPGDRFAECRDGVVAGGSAAIGGPFSLVRHDGVAVTDAEVIDGPTLIYFGFTYCPDVCPLDVNRNAEAVQILEEEHGVEVTPVMITIDPARDTPEQMAGFVEWMHPRMVGLTGTPEALETAQRGYRVYAAQRGEGEDYVFDHSTFSYLMAPEVGFLEFFRRDVPADAMAERIACFADRL